MPPPPPKKKKKKKKKNKFYSSDVNNIKENITAQYYFHFVMGDRWPNGCPHKGPVMRKRFPGQQGIIWITNHA